MHGQAHRRAGSAVAALVAVLLLSAGPAHAGAAASGADHAPPGRSQDDPGESGRPSDRPPAHAGGAQDAPPPHAHSPAPEDRPPAHARARRASPRHGSRAAPVADPRPGRDRGEPSQAPGRSDGPAPAPAPEAGGGTGLDTELDTDVVDPDATRPLPDRSAAAVSSPVIVASPAVPGTPPPASAAATFTPAPSGDVVAPTLPRDVAPGDDPRPGSDVLAAPPAGPTPELFAAEDVARRVVVPLVLIVAGLVYLLAQGRIDRRGLLLTAPEVAGTEHDDDVFEL